MDMITNESGNGTEYSVQENILNVEQAELEFCVICCCPVHGSSLGLDNGNGNSASLLSNNLAVMFLLSKVLQVPDCQLEENLREGGHPVNWIKLCEQCTRVTRQAQHLHWNICKLERELRAVQSWIVDKAKSSSAPLPLSHSSRTNVKSVWRRTREAAPKCKPLKSERLVAVNPFIEGDRLAESLLREQCPSKSFSLLLPSSHTHETENIKLEVVEANEGEDTRDTLVHDDWSNQDYNDDEDERAAGSAGEVEIKVKFERGTEEEEGEPEVSDSRRGSETQAGSGLKRRKRVRLNGKWRCRHCDQLFASWSSCYLHESEKHPKGSSPFICQVCGKGWKSKASYSQHLRNVHEMRSDGSRVRNSIKFREDEGGSECVRKRRNQKMIRINGKLKCRHCDKLFGAMSTCLLHEKEKHPAVPGQFPCDICGKPWNSRDYLRDHRRSVHGLNPEGVPVASKKKKSKEGNGPLKEGAERKKEEKLKWISSRCSGSGVRGVGRNQRKVERVDGKWKCRHCDQLFGANSTCLLHEKEKHPAVPGQHICDICGKTYNSRDYLRDHRRSVHGLNPDGTQVLSKKKKTNKEENSLGDGGVEAKKKVKRRNNSLNSATSLKKVRGRRKRKVERVDGKWKCRHCDQLFVASSSCYLHEREKHVAVRGQFICDICGKAWNSNDYLRGHRRSAHGLNPEGLPVATPNELRKLKEEKTKCRHCDKVFACQRTCDFHEKEKHAENPEQLGQFICDICGKAWNTREYLRKHTAKHKLDATSINSPTKQ